MDRLKQSTPGFLAIVGLMLMVSPLALESLYGNFVVAGGLFLLSLSWFVSVIQKGLWEKQKKAAVVMGLTMALGFSMLLLYESDRPKYQVAISKSKLYTVPPMLDKRELRALGAECNTFGKPKCSHGVFAKLVKMDPKDYVSLSNLAMAQSHLGFHKFAVTNFTRAIQNGVKTYDVYKFYGDSLLAVGLQDKALDAYGRSLQLNPKQTVLRDKIRQISSQ